MRLGAMAVVLALGVGLPAAPALGAQPTPLSQNLEASLIFDQESYPAGGQTQLTVVLTNYGPAELRGITAHCQHYPDDPYLSGREGWGALAEGGPGVTVPAGRTVAVRVSEPVPPASPRHGYVEAFCSFRAAGEPEQRMFRATARVPGLPGSGRGRIFGDSNANRQFDPGEALAGVPVVISDPHTGVPIGRLSTGDDGRFAINDVPAARYDLWIDGPWQPWPGNHYTLPVVAAEPLSELDFGFDPGSQRLPNLVVSAAFDKPAYNFGDTVRARVTITNIGAVAADGVRVSLDTRGPGLRHHWSSWGEFDELGPGARIEPGSSRTVEIPGTTGNPDSPVVLFAGGFAPSNGDLNPANNGFGIVAPVNPTRGSYTGTVYGDRNNSGSMDPGEELGSVGITIAAGGVVGSFDTSTDAHGRFAFRDIPTGRYYVNIDVGNGFVAPDQEIVLGEGVLDVLVRVARPLSEFLVASVAFTEDTYAVGDTARLTVTLTNRGGAPLTGITALCTGAGDGNEITSEAPGWGELSYQGPGVTVGAGETRTFEVWSIVPPGAFTYGYVSAGCTFGAPPEAEGNPVVGDTGKVPGGVGPARGELIHVPNRYAIPEGVVVPDTKVLLFDKDTGAIVARATSDARGHLEFGNLPAGRYGIRLVGPWKLAFPEDFFQVFHGPEQPPCTIYVMPGPNQPAPDAPPETPQPAPQGGVAPAAQTGGSGGLASTGASVIGLSVMALAALALGSGLVLVRRRRGLS